MRRVFLFICCVNIIAHALGQVSRDCTIEKKDFKGYYIISYENRELRELSNKKKSSTMIDYTTGSFIIDRDSFTSRYLKKALEGKISYVSISSNADMLHLVYDYICADESFVMKKNLEDTLKSSHYYKVKGLKRKSLRIKYVEGEVHIFKIPKKKFLAFFRKVSPEMYIEEPALVSIIRTEELEEGQWKALKLKKK